MLSSFHNGFLRNIMRILWPNKISNVELYKKANSEDEIYLNKTEMAMERGMC